MIVFAWSGFPQYAARCVGAFAKTTSERVVVVGTRPDVPIEGMEKCCGCEVFWIGRNDTRPLATIVGKLPRLIVLSGWAIPAFNRYRDEVRLNGGKVVAMCDNNFVFSFKECLRAIRFRLLFRSKYDAFFVPGKNGVRLLRFYGVPRNKIHIGMYAADSTLFKPGKPLSERPKKIVFVGRLNERKNVRRLVQAFAESLKLKVQGSRFKGWTLELYGSGPLKEVLEELASTLNLELEALDSCICIHPFLQPESLAAKYQEARIFILPSVSEHWGVVVHEAALSGCLLLLSKHIGAAEDFLEEGMNGFSFNPFSVDSMVRVIRRAISLDDHELTGFYEKSLELGEDSSMKKFAKAIGEF